MDFKGLCPTVRPACAGRRSLNIKQYKNTLKIVIFQLFGYICYNYSMSFFVKTRTWYGRFERPISSLSLISGFIFDILTLKRLDTLWENIWIIGHIVIVGIFIVLIHLKKNEDNDQSNPSKAHFWYVNILQFFFGGLLSTFLVFYFRSTDIWVTWPFILILIVAFIANESLKRHYVRLSFQISLFFLSIYSFAIFFTPIILHEIGARVFLISGFISLIFILIFVLILFYFIKDNLKESKKLIFFLILGIFSLINFLYFTNLIPPIPLSLKDAGVYYSVDRNKEGNYVVVREDTDWKKYFKSYTDFKRINNSPVYVYSSIFSPNDLDLNIIHEWQYYDEIKKEWVTNMSIKLDVIGGRDGGFRTYSKRLNVFDGKWKVNIKTEQGQVIGHLRFNLLSSDVTPILISDIKK